MKLLAVYHPAGDAVCLLLRALFLGLLELLFVLGQGKHSVFNPVHVCVQLIFYQVLYLAYRELHGMCDFTRSCITDIIISVASC